MTTIMPPPPFDRELTVALAAINEVVPPSLTAEMIPLLRKGALANRVSDEDLRRGGAFEVTDLSVPGPQGASEISLLMCRPAGARTPVAAVYYIHGGGLVSGHNRSPGILEVFGWAQELRLAVVSVEYRLPPENPHPAPVEDCFAGLMWTIAHADELGIDHGRIVIAGTSSGGGLAAAVAQLARDRGAPAPAGQMLLSPMLDDRGEMPSVKQMAGLGVWDRASNEMGWTALLGARRGGPDVSPYAAPARATDLSALPPAFIDVGSAETFRDEAVDYAQRLWQAGGQAELHVWPGGFHGFDLIAPRAAISHAAKSPRLPWLRRHIMPDSTAASS